MNDRTAPGRPLRIVRVIARLNMGGPARHVILLDRGLGARGHQTLLAHGALDAGEGSLEHLAGEHGVPVTRVPGLGRRISPVSDLRAFVRLLGVLFRERPDVVHTHTAKAGTLGRLAALVFNATRSRGRRCVIVHTFHGHVLEGYFHPVIDRLVRTIERTLAVCTDRIVTISPAQQYDISERFRVAPRTKTSVVPLGLDLDALLRLPPDAGGGRAALGIPPGDVVIGYVGRMVPIKQLPLLVSAFAEVRRQHDHVWLVFAGDGPMRGAIEAMVHALGIVDRVRWLGWTEDLPGVYAALDVCALTSLNEGTPVALIEAMAAGRAVVATCVGGVPDVVEDGVSGVLVPPRDHQALTAAMLALVSDAGYRRRLGERARQQVEARYSVERLVDDVERLYWSVLARRRAGGERPVSADGPGPPAERWPRQPLPRTESRSGSPAAGDR